MDEFPMKSVKTFENKKVLVLGLAKSGEAAARLLTKLKAIVTVNDGKPFDENPSAQALLEDGIKVICGSHPLELLDENFELMVKNPGIRYDNPMVARALEKGIPVITEVELAYLISEAPIIGITGSNGKTTTTTMIADVLNNGGQSGLLSGNIGFPASEVAQTATAQDTLVMELSSFQLMGVESFYPHIAVITNLMPTHIDYHGSFEDYVAAKWNIQKNMTDADFMVLNFNQDLSKELAQKTQATVVPFSTLERVDGAYLENGTLYFKGEAVMKADEIGVPGSHNIENALATIAAAEHVGVSIETACEALSHFGGVKRRMELLGTVRGVEVYDDFAHHPTAIDTTLEGARKRLGERKLWAIIEPRSNTMRMGSHKDGLAHSARLADEVIWYQPEGLDWDLQPVIDAAPNKAIVARSLDDIIKTVASEAGEGDAVVIMSNGGFGGLHQKLISALKA